MMKRLHIVMTMACIFAMSNTQAQTWVGNGESMNLSTSGPAGWLNSLSAAPTGVFKMERVNSSDVLLYATQSNVSLVLSFKTDDFYDPYTWKQINEWGSTVKSNTFNHSSSTQTFTMSWNMSGQSLVSNFAELEFNSGSGYGGAIGIQVVWLDAPNAPTSISGNRSGDGTSVNLSWNLSEPELISGVLVQRNSGGTWVTEANLSSAATSVSLSNQPASATQYRVRASNPSGNSSYSTYTLSALSTPNAPSGLSVSRNSSTGKSANLNWGLSGLVSKIQIEHRVKGSSSWNRVTVNSKITSRSIPGLQYDTGYDFRVRAGNAAGYGAWSSIKSMNSVPLKGAVDAKIINPYTYVITWSDPNPSYFEGTLYIEGSTSPGNYYYYATIEDFHATSYILGFDFPNRDFRVNFVDEYGRHIYSNVAYGKFKAVDDLEVFRPYYYNLRWTDPNPEFITGKIEVQQNGYWGSPTSYYTIATINDVHATSYYIGPGFTCDKNYRLRMTNFKDNSVVYSNISTTDLVCGGRGIAEDDPVVPSSVRVYPSPAQGQIFLEADFLTLGETYSIVDMRGVVVQQGALRGQVQNSQESIDVSQLEPGVYFLMANDVQLGRFIKQ